MHYSPVQIVIVTEIFHNYVFHNQGITISIGGPFMIGNPATPRCISDSGVADRIEWRSSEGDVLASGTSVVGGLM